jgi:hypothetical protein
VTAVRVLLAAALASVAACSAPRAADRPALIVEPDAASRAELTRALGELLGVERVTVAEDAFVGASELTFEQREPGALAPRVATGRTLEPPARVRLVLRGTACVLVREGGGRERALERTRCVAAPAAR